MKQLVPALFAVGAIMALTGAAVYITGWNYAPYIYTIGAGFIAQVQTQPEEDFIFNDRDLNYYWQEYAGQLPKEQVAIAKRMQVIRPVLLNNSTTFEVVVDNEIAAKDFTALIPELQTYLRGRLKNSKVAMTVRVSEPAETVRAVGRVEKFQMMAQKNQALMQLKDEFGLELY